MSHFYGTVAGRANKPATQCGTKSSGLTVNAACLRGTLTTELYEVDGETRFHIVLQPWKGSGGVSTHVASGVLDAASPTIRIGFDSEVTA